MDSQKGFPILRITIPWINISRLGISHSLTWVPYFLDCHFLDWHCLTWHFLFSDLHSLFSGLPIPGFAFPDLGFLIF